MTPEEVLRANAIAQAARPNRLMQALPYAGAALGAAGLYGANALVSGGNESWDRTAENTAGNLAGGLAGVYAGSKLGLGIPGMVVGGVTGVLGGGYLSDRAADVFDPTQGQAIDLINAHLNTQPETQQLNPYQQEAMLRQQMQQVRAAQQQQIQAQRQLAMQQYQQ